MYLLSFSFSNRPFCTLAIQVARFMASHISTHGLNHKDYQKSLNGFNHPKGIFFGDYETNFVNVISGGVGAGVLLWPCGKNHELILRRPNGANHLKVVIFSDNKEYSYKFSLTM